MDLIEPRWRTNSSFSPLSRIWDCRFQSDSLLHGSHGASVHGSLSSNSKGSRSRVGSDRYTNHHHSVSDGILSYSGSPPNNFQAPRWTSPVQKFNVGDLPNPSIGGSRSETTWFPHSTERRYTATASCSYASPSSHSESGPWESSSKQPLTFPNRNYPSRRSFMSKPVYPLVFHNPVSDCETTVEQKFHRTLTELQKVETSTDPSGSSRRDGFRWSSGSSYDMFDGENFDIADNMEVESLRSPNGPMGDQKCGVCGKLLWQKSPWSSRRIMRGGDPPISGVLPCCHVFHAECLEQVTPKIEIHDPPCPVCLKTVGSDKESPLVSEPLQMALRSLRRRENLSNEVGGSVVKGRLRKHFTFKGKMAKDFFSKRVFRRSWSSSSSREPVQRQISMK